jgi:hypothetical protein
MWSIPKASRFDSIARAPGTGWLPRRGSIAAGVSRGGFWDFKHGSTGVAPNAIELHPILRFACLSGY